MVALWEVALIFCDCEGSCCDPTIASVEGGGVSSRIDALCSVLVTVGIGEISDDVSSRLIDAPIQPCSGRYNTVVTPSTFVSEFVDIVHMHIRWLSPHGFEFRVEVMGKSLDGQETPLVPESIVIGVPCGNGSRSRNEE